MSERIRNKERLTALTAGTVLGITALSGCGENNSVTPDNTPSTSIDTVSIEDKYSRGIEITPLFPEAQALADRTEADTIVKLSDTELADLYTLTPAELGSYSSTEELAYKWAVGATILQNASGTVLQNDTLSPKNTILSDEAIEILIRPYAESLARNTYGVEGDLDMDYYIAFNSDTAEFKYDKNTKMSPVMQEYIQQVDKKSVEVLREDDESVTFTYKENMNSKYDLTELQDDGWSDPKPIIDQTIEYRVTIPNVPSSQSNEPIVATSFESTSCVNNKDGSSCD